ncbi:putative Mn2+ and Fe2+ transporters of the NRAMP family [Methanocella conradii HZ254]|uniref:Mn2+ and Fe2+ transporters of the NRAMP family n=1 Tax=Methanocella conradii (strain DSM 24694 / JCM 17849 / CGMCC 1.5162 / HZ254) TaxID=1041930 RepID=H8I9K3_METCZ|nr:Nramp family divalent metal transporter [Methanocella conradii]AFD00048.1 putative Mn2+ and Fe2+ transporters of the NRAMP family [Methanocella conradii HZ254]MDI6896133.1 Nramp family divalent metal transporter [Methanocella conradii]
MFGDNGGQRRHFSLKGLLLFLAVVGPGIVTASVDNDAGGITTYTLAGAHFGYALLWTLVPITVALIVVQEMCARMGVVTGKGLSDLIRENFGVRITVLLIIALVIANLGNTMSEFAGVAASMELFGASRYISVPIAAALVWLLVVKGTYSLVEKVFLVASGFYATYIISGFMAGPDWGNVLENSIIPSFSFQPGYLLMFIGLVGTTIAPWMQFYIQSAIVEKGIRIQDYLFTRIDVIMGCFVTAIVAFFIIMTCSATLFVNGVTVETAADAARALAPLAGQYASWLFAFGLFNASVFAASILPLATAYTVCEGIGWESGIDKKFEDAPHFYVLYTSLIVLGALAILIPGAPLITIMFISQVLNGMLLPFILVFMLILINDKKLMGDHTNSRLFNVLAWGTTIIMSFLTLLLVVTSIIPELLG